MPVYVNPNPPGTSSGISAPQLPVWMLDATDDSAPDVGCLTTNNAAVASTTAINYNYEDLHTPEIGNIFQTFPPGYGVLLTDNTTGLCLAFIVSAVSFSASPRFAILTVNYAGAALGLLWTIGHNYSVSFYSMPTLAQLLSAIAVSPIADGTYFGITFKNGIAISAATPIADGTTSPVTSLTFGSGGAPLTVS